MAFLLPENLASRGDVPAALQSLATALRDFVDDDVTVWCDEDPQGDPYLVVLDPRAGVALLRVRGGQPDAALRQAEALTADEARQPTFTELLKRLDPARSEIASRIAASSHLQRDIPVVQRVALPTVDRSRIRVKEGKDPRNLERLLTKDDLVPDKLRDALTRVIKGSAQTPLSANEERAVRGAIHPDIVIHDSDADDAEGRLVFRPPEGGEDVIAVLDRQQESLARYLGDGYRVIKGVAGSGKTLVLTFRARFLAEHFPNKTYLVTCFNIVLASALAKQLADLPNVTVQHIDSLAAQVISRAGQRSPEDWTERRIMAAEILRGRDDLARYDGVFVDEAQDFDGPGLDLAWAFLKDPAGGFVMALDGAQNIYRKTVRWNPPGQTARGRTKVLWVNYRNTREILEFAYSFLTRGAIRIDATGELEDQTVVIPPEATSRRGPKPVVLQVSSPRQEIKEILDRAERAHADGVPWSSMVVLCGSKRWQKALWYATKERGIPYFHVTHNSKSKRESIEKGEVLRCSTLQGVKGLEFSRVFLADVNGIYVGEDADLETQRRLAYVGMTRALDELVVTVVGSGPIGSAVLEAAQ